MDDLFDSAEMEPDGPETARINAEAEQALFEILEPSLPEPDAMALAKVLPEDFNLPQLLRFLPDPRLKQKLDAQAATALAIKVEGEAGLATADRALVALRAGVKEIEDCFAEPTTLANTLHKRLTGLRADFVKNGSAAVSQLNSKVYMETRRIEAEKAQERRRNQDIADQEARESARQAVSEAAQTGLPQEVVQEMAKAAETATAPPVAPAPAPLLRGTTTVEKWKARLKGTLPEGEPNPAVKDLTTAQQAALLDLLAAIVEGHAPLAALKELDWGYLNKRAESEKTKLPLAGLEAFDAGSVRAKPQGRRK